MELEHEEKRTSAEQILQGITMSEQAIAQALVFQEENQSWRGKPMRLYLQGKGCDGFYYGLSFDEHLPDDSRFPQNTDKSIEVVVDPDSLEFVTGSHIIWVDDERGRGFLVENPRHKKFRGKFYKRSSWQEKLKQKLAIKNAEEKPYSSQEREGD